MKKLPVYRKAALLLVLAALAVPCVSVADDGVVDKAGRGIKKGGDAAGRGIEKGADATDRGLKKGAEATERGVKKGAEATGKGLKKAGNWVSNKLDKVFK